MRLFNFATSGLIAAAVLAGGGALHLQEALAKAQQPWPSDVYFGSRLPVEPPDLSVEVPPLVAPRCSLIRDASGTVLAIECPSDFLPKALWTTPIDRP